MSRGPRSTPPPNARRAAVRGLLAIEQGKRSRLRDAVDFRGLADRDRDFAWEIAQGTERLHRWLDFVLSQFVRRKLPKIAMQRCVLRLGAYQLLMLSRVPARAAVHETVGLLRDRGFANAVLRQLSRSIEPREPHPDAARREVALPAGPDGPRSLVFATDVLPPPGTAEFLAVRYGLPDEAIQRWVEAYGLEDTEAIARASHAVPRVFLRPTYREPDPETLATALAAAQVDTEPVEGGLLRVLSGNAFASPSFAAGGFVAQDPTAFAAVRAVEAQAGERILDLCAAPGTKTTRLLEDVATGDQPGVVYAMDRATEKLERIRENAERLGLADSLRLPDSHDEILADPVDRVLVDVPCSNSGVLARRVEVRRRLGATAVESLLPIQRQCLELAVRCCRIGGRVVYSTCSIEPEENQQQIEALLASADPGLRCERLDERLTLPREGVGDGGYFAALRRLA